ncbi:cytochrome c oxidase accessory protein CcoG [compost metagenome]
MLKINKPANLIGFYNQDFIEKRTPFKVSFKSYAYAAVLVMMMFIFSALIYKRQDVETTVLRASGTLFQARPNGEVSNLYNAELINKTNKPIEFVFRSKEAGDQIEFIQKKVELPKEGTVQITFFLIRKQADIKSYKSEVSFEVLSDGQVISTANTTFFAQP